MSKLMSILAQEGLVKTSTTLMEKNNLFAEIEQEMTRLAPSFHIAKVRGETVRGDYNLISLLWEDVTTPANDIMEDPKVLVKMNFTSKFSSVKRDLDIDLQVLVGGRATVEKGLRIDLVHFRPREVASFILKNASDAFESAF